MPQINFLKLLITYYSLKFRSQAKDGSKQGAFPMASYGSVPNLSQAQLYRKQQLQKQRAAAATSGLSTASAAISGMLAGTSGVSITPTSGGAASKYSPATVKQVKYGCPHNFFLSIWDFTKEGQNIKKYLKLQNKICSFFIGVPT